jgi:hypothetical protein
VVSTYSPDELAGLLRDRGLEPELTRVRQPREGEYPADKIRISARRRYGARPSATAGPGG